MSEDIPRECDIDALCLLILSRLLEYLWTKPKGPKGLLYTYNALLIADEARIVIRANPLTLNTEPRAGNDVLSGQDARYPYIYIGVVRGTARECQLLLGRELLSAQRQVLAVDKEHPPPQMRIDRLLQFDKAIGHFDALPCNRLTRHKMSDGGRGRASLGVKV